MPGINYRATINDNMLVTVMIETLEGVAMANEIAATHGVDVVLMGNNDLASFSGWSQNDPRYQDAIIKVHDAALRYGKYYGNAGQQYLTGYTVSADTRMVQDGPACDGWRRPTSGRRGAGGEEPVIGLPAGGATPAAKPDVPAARDPAFCWPWMAAGGQEKK
jgi:HpcH/HpaI aldolase/citrate lyase family